MGDAPKVTLNHASTLPVVKRANGIPSTENDDYRLQILHASDMEADVVTLETAPRFAALVDRLEDNPAVDASGSNSDLRESAADPAPARPFPNRAPSAFPRLRVKSPSPLPYSYSYSKYVFGTGYEYAYERPPTRLHDTQVRRYGATSTPHPNTPRSAEFLPHLHPLPRCPARLHDIRLGPE